MRRQRAILAEEFHRLLPILENLWGRPWDEVLEAYVRGATGSCALVVATGHPQNTINGRVVVILDQFHIVQGIYQQQLGKVEVVLPAWYTECPEMN
jgi:hypothetical protein